MSPSVPVRVLIIADDLTGAMDAAGPFASRGLVTVVVASPDDCDAHQVAHASVVSVNTESRHLPLPQAAARVESAFRRLGGAGFAVVVKKIDSTLRGNVIGETVAALHASGRGRAIVAPAFPHQGRTVVDGCVLVDGVPLAETAFVQDALSPALQQPLAAAFAATGVDAVIHDASTDADLDAVLASVRLSAAPLLVGSAGLTAALARALPGGEPMSPVVVEGRIVYIVGSRAASSREQVMQLANAGVRVVLAPNGEPVADGMALDGDFVIAATRAADGTEADAMEVAARLADHALAAARVDGTGAIVATGGDTAMAILRAAGRSALDVTGELLPGIACARLAVDDRVLWLVTKAGGFGAADALLRIGQRLRGEVA